MRSTNFQGSAVPWWRVGMVWLVIAGPALVVVASIGMAWLAWSGTDTIVSDPRPSLAADRDEPSTPAMKARNHAATPRRP